MYCLIKRAKPLVLSCLLLLLCACSAQGSSSNMDALTSNNDSNILFQDDFSNPKSGWDRASQGGNSTDYADGHYRITLETPQQDIWANPYQALTAISL